MRDELKVIYQGKKLENPHIAVLEIANVGRSAILSSSFDGDRGLVFETPVPIIKVLDVECMPSSAPKPQIVELGNGFELRPELISGGEIVTALLLSEGALEELRLVSNTIGDVAVDVRDRDAWLRQRASRRLFATAIGSIAVTGAVIAALILLTRVPSAISSGAQDATKLRYCKNLTKAAREEATELEKLRGSISIDSSSGRVAGHSQSYGEAYFQAMSSTERVFAAKAVYVSAGQLLTADPASDGDLVQIQVDLTSLNNAVLHNGIGGAEWNQLTDYAANFSRLSLMTCGN